MGRIGTEENRKGKGREGLVWKRIGKVREGKGRKGKDGYGRD